MDPPPKPEVPQCETHSKKYSHICEECCEILCQTCLNAHIKEPIGHTSVLSINNSIKLMEYHMKHDCDLIKLLDDSSNGYLKLLDEKTVIKKRFAI